MANKKGEIVWMKCRANGPGCGANQVTLVWVTDLNKTPNSGGGKSYRYRCISCKGVFHVRL